MSRGYYSLRWKCRKSAEVRVLRVRRGVRLVEVLFANNFLSRPHQLLSLIFGSVIASIFPVALFLK